MQLLIRERWSARPPYWIIEQRPIISGTGPIAMIIPGSVHSLRYISVSLALEASGRFKDRKRHTRPFESYHYRGHFFCESFRSSDLWLHWFLRPLFTYDTSRFSSLLEAWLSQINRRSRHRGSLGLAATRCNCQCGRRPTREIEARASCRCYRIWRLFRSE